MFLNILTSVWNQATQAKFQSATIIILEFIHLLRKPSLFFILKVATHKTHGLHRLLLLSKTQLVPTTIAEEISSDSQ